MKGIRQFSKEPGYNTPVDEWSFAIKQEEWDDVSAGITEDFGMEIFFRQEGDLRVRKVEAASPAGIAGVKRGWRITKINNSSNITTSNADFIVNAVYLSKNVAITFQKPDGSTVDLNITAGTYQNDVIAAKTIIDLGSKQVGYLAYHSFLGDSARTVDGFAAAFSEFATAGIDEMVLDLRYNGGGYVWMQALLANYLAPTSANAQVMMTQQFNDRYSQYNSSINFSKKGTLNLSRLFVIISDQSASSSELLINNLKAVMDVQLVGPENTYGKPVGYFEIPVGDYYIFPVSSRTTNKNGLGNYFGGFAPNSVVADGLDKDFGDPAEACFASALKYIGTGSYRMPAIEDQPVLTPQVIKANEGLPKRAFRGMIMERKF